MRNGWLSIFVTLCLCVLSFASSAQTDFAVSPTCKVNVDKISAVKTSSIDVVPKTGWVEVKNPDVWTERWPHYDGGVWYHFNWHWSCNDSNELKQPLAFSVEGMSSAGAVFFNRNLLWKDKHLVEPLSKSWNTPRFWILPVESLKQKNNDIWVYVVGNSYESPGLGKLEFSDITTAYDKQQKRIWNKRALFQVNLVISTTLGLVCFVIWFFRRNETTFLWFSVSCLFWVLFIWNVINREVFPYPNSLWVMKTNLTFFVLYNVCFCIYLLRFVKTKFAELEKTLFLVAAVCIVTILFIPSLMVNIVFAVIFLLCIALFIASFCFVIYRAYKTKRRDYILLVVCLSVILIVMLYDISLLFDGHINDHQPLSPYTSPVITFFIVIILATRLDKNIKKIQRFNSELEQRVSFVTSNLSSSLYARHQLELENVRLQERIHLAHDLHDGLGASLVRSMILVDQSSSTMSNQQFLSILKLLRDDLRQIIDSGSLTNNKTPDNPVLWIAPVRHRFSQIMDELDIEATWSIPEAWEIQPTALQCLTLIRVLEESLTNIVKHSQARHIDVKMYYPSTTHLVMIIQDDGVGFNVECVLNHGMGIGMRSMKMRLEKIGAELNIESEKGCTKIIASLRFGEGESAE